MKFKIVLFIVAVVATALSYLAYYYESNDLYSRPDLPEGAFSLSFSNGFRAVMVRLDDVRPKRRYIGVTEEVPRWYVDTWSICTAPTRGEIDALEHDAPGSRLEAICIIEAQGYIFHRGAIFSVRDI